MKLLIATTNPGKIREFREMLGSAGFEFTDLTQHPELPPVEETGQTFAENAALKATTYARSLGVWALADDSGLAVDALGGKPGVHSARWAEIHKSGRGDESNNALLLTQLCDVPQKDRTAQFVCALALADPWGKVVLATSDMVEGRILTEPRGVNGFGYDPLFVVENLNKTTAELPPEVKHSISHRGKAMRKLAELINCEGLTGE